MEIACERVVNPQLGEAKNAGNWGHEFFNFVVYAGLFAPDQRFGRAFSFDTQAEKRHSVSPKEEMSESPGEVTLLLADLCRGDQGAANQLLPLIYGELRRMAGRQMQHERADHTLQATALVNEVYIRMTTGEPVPWQSRVHFFAVAASAMRRVLLDYARSRTAKKRGGKDARKVTLGGDEHSNISTKLEDIIAINEALERLEQIDAKQGRLVHLRFFAGLSVEEASELMNVSPRTIRREWRMAKAWLHRELARTIA
jgi:RNA polymerase sigma factor (TIGR02999 family)